VAEVMAEIERDLTFLRRVGAAALRFSGGEPLLQAPIPARSAQKLAGSNRFTLPSIPPACCVGHVWSGCAATWTVSV